MAIRNITAMTTVLTLMAVMSGGAFVNHCVEDAVMGMATPSVMTGGRDIRPTYGRGYLMTNAVFRAPCCGVIKEWTINRDRNAVSHSIEFHVWRRVNGSTYRLIGRNTFRSESNAKLKFHIPEELDEDVDDDDDEDDDEEDDEGGFHQERFASANSVSFVVPEDERIAVRVDDYIGWRTPLGDIISYTNVYHNLDNIIVNAMPAVNVESTYVFPASLAAHRTYGINAKLTRGTSPVIINLPASVEVSADMIEGTAIFNVSGHDPDLGDTCIYVIPNGEVTPFSVDPESGVVTLKGKLTEEMHNVPIGYIDVCGLYDLKVLTVHRMKSNTSSEFVLPQTTIKQPIELEEQEVKVQSLFTSYREGDEVSCAVSSKKLPGGSFNVTENEIILELNNTQCGSDAVWIITLTCSDGSSNTSGLIQFQFELKYPPDNISESAYGVDGEKGFRVNVTSTIGDVTEILLCWTSQFCWTLKEQKHVITLSTRKCNFCQRHDKQFFCQIVTVTPANNFNTIVIKALSGNRSFMAYAEVNSTSSASFPVNVTDTEGVNSTTFSEDIFPEVSEQLKLVNLPRSLALSENFAPGEEIFTVVTNEKVFHQNVTVHFVVTQGSSGLLGMRGNTLFLKQSCHFDFETARIFRISFVATNGYSTSDPEVLTLELLDVNEAPLFVPEILCVTTFEGNAGSVASSGVIYSAAVDPDVNESFKFYLMTPCDHFTINQTTAELEFAVNYDIDNEVMPAHLTLIIKVVDSGFLSATAEVMVTILNRNEPPVITNLPRNISVAEDMLLGSFIYRVHAVDPEKDNLFFQATFLQGNERLFKFNNTDGTLTLSDTSQPNYEVANLFSLRINVDDGTLTSESLLLDVTIRDVNEAPVFTVDNLSVSVDEGQGETLILNETIRQLTFDPDVEEILHYSLLPGNFSDYFFINGISGQLYFARDYDSDPLRLPPNVTLTVQVKDTGDLTDTLNVNLAFRNVNQAPVLQSDLAEVQLPENSKPGSLIYSFTAHDPDSMDVLRFSIAYLKGRESAFVFNETDGVLYLNDQDTLDYETVPFYSVRVWASDGQLMSRPTTVNIYVTDVNESPYFTRDHFYVTTPEGPAGTKVTDSGILEAAGDTEKDRLTFSLLPGQGSSSFSIDMETAGLVFATDMILSKGHSPMSLRVVVKVKDTGGLSATAHVTITIYDVNTRPHLLFLPSNITVSDTCKQGTLLYTVHAEDLDGDSLTFHMNVVDGVGGSVAFNLNSSSGKLILEKGSFDNDGTPYYEIQFSVNDGQSSSEPGNLGLVILRGETESPRLLEYNMAVLENEVAEPLPIPQFWSSSDINTSQPLNFKLKTGTGSDFFEVDHNTGDLLPKGNLDLSSLRENHTFSFDVTVSDKSGRNKSARIRLTIADVNDNAPEVRSNIVSYFVNKNSKVGTVIGRIEARDRDKGKNAELAFQIKSSTLPEGAIQIASTGDLIVSKSLTEVIHPTASLEVTISDRGSPPLSTSVGIFIIFTSQDPASPKSALSAYQTEDSGTTVTSEVNTNAKVVLVLMAFTVVMTTLAYCFGRNAGRRNNIRDELTRR